jgi:hypothetical protein
LSSIAHLSLPKAGDRPQPTNVVASFVASFVDELCDEARDEEYATHLRRIS